MLLEKNLYDVTIIGGGPTGLFAAFYAGMRQMKVKIIESMPQLGGQLSALYPEKFIYDVAGFPKVRAQRLVDQLVKQAKQFHPTIVLSETVQDVKKIDEQIFRLTTDANVHYSKTIIITAGVGAFQPRRLQVSNAMAYEGRNLHYFINDLSRFADKKVCIFGGGDSAVDWALMLEPIAEHVTVVHRRNQFRAHEGSVEQLKASNATLLTPYEMMKIDGDGEKIQQIIIQKVKEEETKTIEVDEVVVNFGFVSSLGPIKDWGLNIEKNSIVVNTKMETNIEGIYSAGDVSAFDGKVKLIATGFGEASIAVSSAKTYIDPKARMQPQHSTSLF
ncbi:ferredoxin--NADP(+) reductase [Pueribacillus theae]|uniref:Ferredoxin--NADP reductase n=1 Tax=Pueribacillus theae TaxID=2171751 RepID=A0A2U1K688_9BACI|nr:NAD(P)/FAD-dependent oxidoreductase [Pueribacillus theae]PWA13037.1 ferredoxin--NADP(+) reductase [Pueribacillus theae]